MGASAEEFEYEVFLNYDRRERGAGSFFPLQLHEHLNRNGIRTYKYSEDLEEGEEIAPAVHQAIEASRIAVVILSKDYASSASCLSELGKILEQKNQMGRKELPLFYRVEPSWVRYQKESYEEAMMEHERRYGSGSAKVAQWREALTEVGERRGWTLGANEEDAELARRVAGDIGTILRQLQAPTFPIISPEHLHWAGTIGILMFTAALMFSPLIGLQLSGILRLFPTGLRAFVLIANVLFMLLAAVFIIRWRRYDTANIG